MEIEQKQQNTTMLSEKEVATEETKVKDHNGDKDDLSDENDLNNSGGEDSDCCVPLIEDVLHKPSKPNDPENKSRIQTD